MVIILLLKADDFRLHSPELLFTLQTSPPYKNSPQRIFLDCTPKVRHKTFGVTSFGLIVVKSNPDYRRFTFVRIARVIASPVSMNSASL